MSLKQLVDLDGLSRFKAKILELIPGASSDTPAMDGAASAGSSATLARGDHVHPTDTTRLSTTGDAYRTASIPMGAVDSTSTATVFTATVPGITELRDGVCMWLTNGVITSASGFTININGLGAKPVYQNMAAASRSTTVFNIAYTMLFIYNEDRVSGGCWDIVYGYNSDNNTTAYMIRNYQSTLIMNSVMYRYQISFTKPNGKLVPANAVSNNQGTSKTLTTEAFDPLGDIWYYSTTTAVAADASPGASYMWLQHNAVNLKYSFNAGETLVAKSPVYVRCVLQSDGTAKLDGNDCITQALPSTEDGKLYIHIGTAYSAYQIDFHFNKPVLWYKDGRIRQYVGDGVYIKPSGGIPDTDLSQAVQTSLGKADTALQSFTESDPTVPSWAKQSSKPSYAPSEVGAVALAQGVAHAGEFCVVGSDGNVTTVAMTAWQGGNY